MYNDQSSYDAGFADGKASRDAEVEALNHVADYWYFRACNPGAKTADEQIIDSIIDGMEVRERWEKKRKELDAVEEQMFNQARELIMTTGMTDIQIAVKVGLFAPTVGVIRHDLGNEVYETHTEKFEAAWNKIGDGK
jgi:hypothetical protein